MCDDGYDVSNYYTIQPMYGNLDEFHNLVNEVHNRGLRILVELIPNHTSDQHPWFIASRDPSHPEHARYRDYYVWSDTDQCYQAARIIFRDFEKSNWSYDSLRRAYYWHRFFYHQPDLNYDNGEVQRAMLRVVQFWIDQGVDGIRVDAPSYLYERDGTSCENLPETHAFLKRLRAFIEGYAPGTLLLSEANQLPEDVRLYFGDGDEMHMNYHFPIMPRIFMALAQANRTPIVEILNRTPEIPPTCQWGIFLRCHDELTLEMLSPDDRQYMWDYYAPEARMRLNLGIRRRLAPLLENDQRKIKLAHSLLLTLPGSPFLYYGDEIGMGDNIWLEDREGLRTPMQWNSQKRAGFSSISPDKWYAPLIDQTPHRATQVNVADQVENPDSLFNAIRKMIQVRRMHQAFGRGTIEWLMSSPLAVLGYWRKYQSQRLLVINNLSGETQTIKIDYSKQDSSFTVILSSHRDEQGSDLTLGQLVVNLNPYQYIWMDFKRRDA